MLARGRGCAGVAMDGDETGVPRAAAVRLALLARVIRGRARPRLERRIGDLLLLYRPTDVEQARRPELRGGGGHRDQDLIRPWRGCGAGFDRGHVDLNVRRSRHAAEPVV